MARHGSPDQRRVGYVRERSGRIPAAPEQVWPWLVQMGFDRGGWYAIDRLEKLFGVGRFATGRSAIRVEPALQDLAVGDRVPLSRGRWLNVAELSSNRRLVLVLPPGFITWVWSFDLAAEGDALTRLTITTELSVPARRPAFRAFARAAFALFDIGHGMMEAVQFRTLARRIPAAVDLAHRDNVPLDQRTGVDLEELRRRAITWAASDPDPVTRDELMEHSRHADAAYLRDLVGAELTFGTAGLRGRVGPGPNRMNRAVVLRTTRGLVDHLLATDPKAPQRGIVVAFDARRDSERFARDVVGVVAAAGLNVHRFLTHQPTPVAAFAQRALDAAACVVVTASHNPPDDNGYKVYVEGAAQIVPPTDAAIAAAIAQVGSAAEIPRISDGELDAHPRVHPLDERLLDAYLAELGAARPEPHPRALETPFRIAYTPLHGVGRDLVLRALADAGHTEVHVAPSQAEPDGSFPTVRFPNPEEPGALDAVIALGRDVNADLVIANDPDADRLAIALPDGQGDFVPLTGNRIGVLLADHCLSGVGRGIDIGGSTPLVVSSIVSTPMVASVAEQYGARNEVTLTGFKWICAASRALTPQGYHFVFGFEEALGSAVGSVVADKDGISAAVVFADLARGLAAEGRTVQERLDELHRAHGLWVSRQASVVHEGQEGAQRIAAAMQRLGAVPPETLGGAPVRDVTDFRVGGEERPAWLPEQDLIAFTLDEGRVMIRPSGTEPKCKVYVDIRADVAPDVTPSALAAVEAGLHDRAGVLAQDLLRFADL